MGKSVNIKKSAAAQAQSFRAIQKALKNDEPGAWMSVQKALGNGYFLLRNKDGREGRGTPRGLFTCGNMRISVGQIVVVEGDLKLGVEIIGAIQQRREAEDYVKSGRLPVEVLVSAVAMGGAVEAVDEDDFFEEAAAEDAPEARGGLKEQRAAAETRRTISARAAMLIGGGPAAIASAAGHVSADVDVDAI